MCVKSFQVGVIRIKIVSLDCEVVYWILRAGGVWYACIELGCVNLICSLEMENKERELCKV
jgi:hypothetical protein